MITQVYISSLREHRTILSRHLCSLLLSSPARRWSLSTFRTGDNYVWHRVATLGPYAATSEERVPNRFILDFSLRHHRRRRPCFALLEISSSVFSYSPCCQCHRRPCERTYPSISLDNISVQKTPHILRPPYFLLIQAQVKTSTPKALQLLYHGAPIAPRAHERLPQPPESQSEHHAFRSYVRRGWSGDGQDGDGVQDG